MTRCSVVLAATHGINPWGVQRACAQGFAILFHITLGRGQAEPSQRCKNEPANTPNQTNKQPKKPNGTKETKLEMTRLNHDFWPRSPGSSSPTSSCSHPRGHPQRTHDNQQPCRKCNRWQRHIGMICNVRRPPHGHCIKLALYMLYMLYMVLLYICCLLVLPCSTCVTALWHIHMAITNYQSQIH